ncbi:MAG: hypothetical protein CL911_00475 [Deltaproteobacteria bacterium]|nr:hypothetical protein [Deltaproteobacteria bacterium]
MTTVASKRVYLETLGCSKNRVDSEVMLAHLAQAGYELVESEQNAEVIIVNTCGFLTAASEESVNRILELSDQKSSGSCEKLVATGCLTQRYREELSEEIPELDGLLGSHGFEHIPELISAMYEHPEHPQIFLSKKPHYTHYEQQERPKHSPAFCLCENRRGLLQYVYLLQHPLFARRFQQPYCRDDHSRNPELGRQGSAGDQPDFAGHLLLRTGFPW